MITHSLEAKAITPQHVRCEAIARDIGDLKNELNRLEDNVRWLTREFNSAKKAAEEARDTQLYNAIGLAISMIVPVTRVIRGVSILVRAARTDKAIRAAGIEALSIAVGITRMTNIINALNSAADSEKRAARALAQAIKIKLQCNDVEVKLSRLRTKYRHNGCAAIFN